MPNRNPPMAQPSRPAVLMMPPTWPSSAAEAGFPFPPPEHRRNLTTRGVRLADLLGRRFRIGQVLLEGVKDCPPCTHLEDLVHKPVLRPLVDRGGLRARIVEGGRLRVGDELVLP